MTRNVTMKKTYCSFFLFVIIASLPQLVLAQASGGAIRRPVRKITTSSSARPSKLSNVSNNHRLSASAPVYSEIFEANGVSFKMIRVDGMGIPFYIGETEVTQSLWQAVMGSNPSKYKGANRPVEQVSWDDCKEFISRLNYATGKIFRLPKEAEWEYAAKGGNKSNGYEYSGSNEINNVAWYDKNAYYCGSQNRNTSHPDYGTHNVKTKIANELGLYDMSGNVWEWCEDSSSSSNRIFRGGGWLSNAFFCRVSYQNNNTPYFRNDYLGLRLAL